MSGYDGFSMSNNAVNAYESGEKPMSKWTKSDILYEINQLDFVNFSIEKFKKLNLATLKNCIFTSSGWHHTSSYYNCTDFYRIDDDFITTLTDGKIDELLEEQKALTKANKDKIQIKEIHKVVYLIWAGTRKHPKPTAEYDECCEIIGQWAFTKNGRKNIYANGFEILD